MYSNVFRFREAGVMCIFITCSSLVFTEALKNHTPAATSLNVSKTGFSSGFTKEKENFTRTEYVREYNVAQRWQSMETSVMKILTLMYNESLPLVHKLTNDLDISTTCKRDLKKMLTGIKEFKYWAVKMLDSFGKIPSGIESGTFVTLGDFDQCLAVDVPGHFQGQYCNLDMIMPLPKRQPFVSTYAEIPEVMKAVKPDGYFEAAGKFGRLFYITNPRVSICVPSTCSREELQNIANKAVQTMDLSFGLNIPNCEVLKEEFNFDSVEITMLIILATLVLLVISATAVDVYMQLMSNNEENGKKNLSLPRKYLLCFSLPKNIERLVRVDTDDDSINIFHGMRVLTTLWVIVTHTTFYHNFKATGSLRFHQTSLKVAAYQFIGNAFINVQTFFFMSATLHAFRTIKEKKKMNIKKHILRRIWRLAPPFMFVICCAILVHHWNTGPTWKETVEDGISKKCRENWWTNLLFINNLISNKDMCLQWLWYLPVDLQLYVLSLVVLIPMKRNPVLGFLINILIMFTAMIISAILHVYYNITPMLVTAFNHPEDIDYYLEHGYFRPYLHVSSICIGLAVGYFLANRPSKLHIPMKINVILWLLSIYITYAVLFGTARWGDGTLPSIWVSMLYAGGGKILWSAAMSWFTVACMTGNGGFVTKFLSFSFFIPVGRLCYMVYIIHSIIHYMYIGGRRDTLLVHVRNVIPWWCGTIFLSFFFAFILTLFFESPFMALDKLIFADKISDKKEKSKTFISESSESAVLKNGDINNDVDSHQKAA